MGLRQAVPGDGAGGGQEEVTFYLHPAAISRYRTLIPTIREWARLLQMTFRKMVETSPIWDRELTVSRNNQSLLL